MTRVSSQKTRQAVLVGGDDLDPTTLPERLNLYDELGRSIVLNPGGSVPPGGAVGYYLVKASGDDYDTEWVALETPVDAGAVHFRGDFVLHGAYVTNDMVIEGGFVWVLLEDIADATQTPTALVPNPTTANPAGAGGGTASRVRAGVNTFPSTTEFHGFFDIATIGHIHIANNFPTQYTYLHNAAGTQIGNSPSLGAPLDFDITSVARYFVRAIDAFGGSGTSVTLTLSSGATLNEPVSPWRKLCIAAS